MSTTPIANITEWAASQAQPHVVVNAGTRTLEVLAARVAIAIAASPPGDSEHDGYAYIVDETGSGLWIDHDNEIAYYSGGWKFLVPRTGWRWHLLSESVEKIFTDGSPGVWETLTGVAPAVVEESGANLDADNANAGNYTRFSHAAPTYTFDDGVGYAKGAEYHGRYTGAGTLTITPNSGMTVNPPAGGSLEVPPGGTFTVKIVNDAGDEADLMGVTVPP